MIEQMKYYNFMSRVESWRNKGQFLRLEGERCNNCNTVIFPPRDFCPTCRSVAKNIYQLSGKGEVYSYTLLRSGHVPKEFEKQAPLVIALVKLDEGPMITTQLTDLEQVDPIIYGIPYKVHIGMEVEMVTRKLEEEANDGVIRYGYKFRPQISPHKKSSHT